MPYDFIQGMIIGIFMGIIIGVLSGFWLMKRWWTEQNMKNHIDFKED